VIRVREIPAPPSPMFRSVRPDDPRVGEVLSLLDRAWPFGYQRAARSVSGWHPVECVEPMGRGCHCGQSPDGWVFSTVNDVPGAVEGILHEMGHLDLHKLGVHLEEWDSGTLLNDPGERYPSPIRTLPDGSPEPRPMGAVLHAAYSYMWVSEFDLRAWRGGLIGREYFDGNVVRVRRGVPTLREHCRPDEQFSEFLSRVLGWGDELLCA